jgi:2'-5' RNA ligase
VSVPRAFAALSLPAPVVSTLRTGRDALIDADPGWAHEKWVASGNLHVTLLFLGDVPDEDLDRLTANAEAALRSAEPYRLRLDDVRAVPRPRAASMLWAGATEGAGDTADVAERIRSAAAFLDLAEERRPFATHVTLCRARHPRPISGTALDAAQQALERAGDRGAIVSVHAVTLVESTLTPRGPVYRHRASIPIGG